MKTVWIASVAVAVAMPCAFAQTTIYKHVDESGRVTYSNKPMKGATVLELEPLTTVPATPTETLARAAIDKAAAADKGAAAEKTEFKIYGAKSDGPAEVKPASYKPVAAVVTPVPRQTVASIEPQVQRRRDDERRKILEQELAREEESLTGARASLMQEQQNPTLVAAVRAAQQAADPTPSQMAEMRNNLDKASGRIRGLQATVAEHEKNIEALKKELGALKP